MKKTDIRLALVCTIGGHFEQLANLGEFYRDYSYFWVTNRNKQTESQLINDRKYFVKEAHFKKPWLYFYQLPKMLKIFAVENPTHVISTGSGRTALIPFLIAKSKGLKFLYIDTFSRVNGYSKFGTFLLKIGHRIFSQWEDPQNPKVQYIGPVFQKTAQIQKEKDSDYIFVTMGTRSEPFTRMLKCIEQLVERGVIKERIIVQAGHTIYSSAALELFDFCRPDEIDALIRNAKYVVTQESAGIGTKCLKFNSKFIVMPRDFKYGELPAKSDMNEDLHLKLAEMGYTKVVKNAFELERAVREIDVLKTGYNFDNTLAIRTLIKEVEEE